VTELLVVALERAARVLGRAPWPRHSTLYLLATRVLPRATRCAARVIQRSVRTVVALRGELGHLMLVLLPLFVGHVIHLGGSRSQTGK
jgi:hypothetical protein